MPPPESALKAGSLFLKHMILRIKSLQSFTYERSNIAWWNPLIVLIGVLRFHRHIKSFYIMIHKNKNGMYEGVVYARKLNNPGGHEDGYMYVGCTMDEATRKCKWDNPNTSNYGGRKICEAREKYGVKSFSYAVLERHQHQDRDQLRKELE